MIEWFLSNKEWILLVFMSFFPPLIYTIWIRNTEKYHREKWEFWEEDLQFILAKSIIYELSIDIAVNAGVTRNNVRKKKKGFGLACRGC